MPFRPGQRVRYTGAGLYHNTYYIGKVGIVRSSDDGITRVVWDKWPGGRVCNHYTGNIELVEPDNPLNAAIRAYVDAEKKELGLA